MQVFQMETGHDLGGFPLQVCRRFREAIKVPDYLAFGASIMSLSQ